MNRVYFISIKRDTDLIGVGEILTTIDYLIEGPFKLKERDITLKWRGSRNQNIINMKTGEIEND